MKPHPRHPAHIVVVGAGAAGLMTARALARAGAQVTILEARDRCGGRIYPLPVEEFGYPAEGGPEFIHGAAAVTRALMREAGLSLSPRGGERWSVRSGAWSPAAAALPGSSRFYQALREVKTDLPIADFLEMHFSGPQFEELRRSITRTVEGYDAADPRRASTLALREEWLARDDGQHGRITEGYGAMIAYLAAECRRYSAALRLGVEVTGIEDHAAGIAVRCRDGAVVEADGAVLSVPLPLLSEIDLPSQARKRAAAAGDIGYGNVVKFLLRFRTAWWADHAGRDLSRLSFLLSDARVPTWWTQHPAPFAVLTGWFAGPKADGVSSLTESDLVEMGLASLAEIFAVPVAELRRQLLAARAINWGNDPFARGAYSYATPQTRAAQALLRQPCGDGVFFSGEALYTGADIGTVEAALAIGLETAQIILAAG